MTFFWTPTHNYSHLLEEHLLERNRARLRAIQAHNLNMGYKHNV